jgi:hypothetical protein
MMNEFDFTHAIDILEELGARDRNPSLLIGLIKLHFCLLHVFRSQDVLEFRQWQLTNFLDAM